MRFKTYLLLVLLFCCPFIHAKDDEFIKTVYKKFDASVNCVSYSLDNEKIIVGDDNKMATIIDLNDDKVLQQIPAHYQPVKYVRFSTVNPNDYFTMGDKSFKLWEIGADKQKKIYTGSHTFITALDMTRNERYFVGGSFESKFRVWEAGVPEKPEQIRAHEKSVMAVAISPNNKYIASGSMDNTIKVFGVDSLKEIYTIESHSDVISFLKFSADGRYLFSGSADNTIKLWEASTGKVIKVYGGHNKGVSCVDISPNGKYILTASYDNSINLYAIATGNRIYSFEAHDAAVTWVEWNKEGDGFVSASKDESVIVWELPLSLYINHYYEADIMDECDQSELFLPKSKSESRDDYQQRLEKGEKFKMELFEKYTLKYEEMLKNQQIIVP